MDASEARRRGLARQSERLSALVSMAVERIIENEDRAALFKRSLRTITRLIKDVPMLTLRVPEADRDSAQGAVDAVMSQLSAALPIEIVADAAIPEGGCRFESDRGVIDAGLDTQLAAIRRAVSRAAHQMARESEAAGDDEAADEPEDELTTATSIDDALEVSRFEADAGDDFVAIDLPAAAAVEAAEELVTDAAEVEEGLTVLDAGDDFVAIDIPAAAAVEAVEDIAEVEETFTVLDAEEDDDEPDDDEQDDEPVHTIVARYVTDDDEPVAEDALAEA
jgi:hypothetical protein